MRPKVAAFDIDTTILVVCPPTQQPRTHYLTLSQRISQVSRSLHLPLLLVVYNPKTMCFRGCMHVPEKYTKRHLKISRIGPEIKSHANDYRCALEV